MVNLIMQLGFFINFDKVSPPTQDVTFLGVQIDSYKRTLSLPPKKLHELKILIQMWLQCCSKQDSFQISWQI